MDYIRLFNPNHNYFNEDKLTSKFFQKGNSRTDVRLNTTFQNYHNNRGVTIIKSGFGTYLDVNPTKYLRSANFNQINRLVMFDFIGELENTLEFNVRDFRLTKFDWNADIYMDNSVSDYMPIFRKTHNYPKTMDHNQSITYSNGSKKFIIYDKCKPFSFSRPFLLFKITK